MAQPTQQASEEAAAARLAAIVESSDDAIVGKTLDGVITSWNPAAERMFGWTPAEAVGKHITLIIPPERFPEEDEVLARIRRGEGVDHFDTIRLTKDGRRLNISLTVSPIRDVSGRVIGASKIARDITDRKLAESERATMLAREQAARAEAEAASRSKDEFLAVLSHELRTPLNAIFGWARMMQGGTLEPAVTARAVEAILRNAEAQARLVEDLLDVSRIISGNLRLDVRPVNLRSVIDAALDAVRPAADARGLRLLTQLDDDVGMIVGSPERLQQTVWNLLSNAVKFTERGGQIRVGLHRVDAHVQIVVSDTGQGIPPELLPYVFDRFRQGDSSSTRAHGGLGLGLALVRHLIELHGGSVTAESPGVGRGATFTVSLPLVVAEPLGAVAVPGVTPEPPGASLRGVRVLVVDDDLDGLEVASVVLTNSGASVRTCDSPAAVIDALADWIPEVAVLDIEMPGEDGFSLLRRVRTLGAARGIRIPALALTAYGRPEDRRRTLAAGFNLHLAKPVDPAELVLAVANLAGRTG
jgi:PAS domain S-box-containing protein